MRKILLRTFFIIFAVSTLAGCAFGQKQQYDTVKVDVHGIKASNLAVSTLDLRPYIVSGKKDPTFVGLQRGGFGNPFDVNTASGKPLSDDMTTVLVNAYKASGIDVTPIRVTQPQNYNKIVSEMKEISTERFVLLILNEWKSDTSTNTALLYNIELQVLDNKGNILVRKTLQGRDDLGGDNFNPPEHARNAVGNEFKYKLEQLLNDRDVINALKSDN